MAKSFNEEEWQTINKKLDEELTGKPEAYGFPQRREGSVLLGSFNIRKLGDPSKRTEDEWAFLARICAQFDLLAVQEIVSGLDGLRHLRDLMVKLLGEGDSGFAIVASDDTGAFVGESGLRERLGFIYRWPVVERMEIASDLTYDRTKVHGTLVENRKN